MRRNTSGLRRGGPGRKKGVPNKATTEAKEFCRRLMNDSSYLAKFEQAWRRRKLPPRLEELVWFYAFGKPTQSIELSEQSMTLEELIVGSRKEEWPLYDEVARAAVRRVKDAESPRDDRLLEVFGEIARRRGLDYTEHAAVKWLGDELRKRAHPGG